MKKQLPTALLIAITMCGLVSVNNLHLSMAQTKPSVPEFPTWIVLPLAMITVSGAVLASKRKRRKS
jgi:hypothetical protein